MPSHAVGLCEMSKARWKRIGRSTTTPLCGCAGGCASSTKSGMQGRDLSTPAPPRALRPRTPDRAWARHAVGEGARSCPREANSGRLADAIVERVGNRAGVAARARQGQPHRTPAITDDVNVPGADAVSKAEGNMAKHDIARLGSPAARICGHGNARLAAGLSPWVASPSKPQTSKVSSIFGTAAGLRDRWLSERKSYQNSAGR
jgi:hypothetical protein